MRLLAVDRLSRTRRYTYRAAPKYELALDNERSRLATAQPGEGAPTPANSARGKALPGARWPKREPETTSPCSSKNHDFMEDKTVEERAIENIGNSPVDCRD